MTNSLELRDVSVHARGKSLVEGVSLSLQPGEFVALIGPNGAGKTTLLRAALGLARATGTVHLGGNDVAAMTPRQRAGHVAWLPQQALISEPISVYQFVLAARFRFRETHAVAERETLAALAKANALGFLSRPVIELSGGEQQRVAVAALIAQGAPLLLLDEPANHLDPAQQIELYSLFGNLWRNGHGVLCITHDINMLRHVGDGAQDIRVVGMAQGRIGFESSFDAPDLPEHVGKLFDVQMQVVQSDDGRLLIPARKGSA
ncbi:MAG: ABC transporter ATP-binding protein [Planctomycetes bacterium]|nr:ABC transporter ATP-binding protein [Planctomycetota bacterium]